MQVTTSSPHHLPVAGSRTRRSRVLLSLLVIVLLAVVHQVDVWTGVAPFQHLYYVPIVIAAIGLPLSGGLAAAVAAVVLYHVGNPRLLTFAYEESDIVQVALFLGVGLVTAKLADDARRLHAVAQTDDLTGLYNLRGFESRLTAAIASARQARTPIALLVLDLDRLKSINDTHGHLAGADAVRTVGHLIARHLPSGTFACRFGGDEFVIGLPGHGADEAIAVANNLLQAISATTPTLAGVPFPKGALTISIGMAVVADASLAEDGAGAGEILFRAADRALYAAKSGGRNQISVAVL